MAVRLLSIGDIHLGRRPTRLSRALVERAGSDRLGPAAAWERAVDEAIALEVDGVLLAGDVVEQDDDFYEAYTRLDAGVRRLTRHGITVVAVAGNHDGMVLPRLAQAIEGFRLLGRRGRWEQTVVSGSASDRVRVVGWSFPSKTVATSPFAGATLPANEENLPTLGLLHCDRDGGGSPYAPVRASELLEAPVDAWLLGHIHAPDPLDGERPIGYLGSLCGLDPSETGPHGPWLVEVKPGEPVRATQLPLAPMRWQTVEVDVGGLAHPDDLDVLIAESIDALHEEVVAGSHHPPLATGCRVRLVGRSRQRAAIDQRLAASDVGELLLERDETLYFIDRATNEALPAVDLDELAKGSDPVGLLARHILLLERPAEDEERRELLVAIRERLGEVTRKGVYGLLGDVEEPTEEEVVGLVRRAAFQALDALLLQDEARQ